MNHLVVLVITAAAAVLGVSLIYKILPFKAWQKRKPKFTLFPKYVASFDRPLAEIKSALGRLQFNKTGALRFSRGKIAGDFSARHIRLAVAIDAEKKQVRIYAPVFGILFDTGDIWQLTSDIIHG